MRLRQISNPDIVASHRTNHIKAAIEMDSTAILPSSVSEFLPGICPPATLPLIEDDELVPLLENAAESELDGLVRVLIRKGGITSQLTGLNSYKEHSPHHRFYVRDIAAEIQKYGGNTLASLLFRGGKGVKYEEIVRDVASKVGVGTGGCTRELESAIQVALLEKIWRDLTPEQRKAMLDEMGIRDYSLVLKAAAPAVLIEAIKWSGFAAYKMSVIVANAVAHAVLGHGLAFAANAALTKGLAVLIGPVGWCIAGFLSAHAIAGEAYRVTVPCVLQITMIRRAAEERNRQMTRRRFRRWSIGASVFVGACILVLLMVWLFM